MKRRCGWIPGAQLTPARVIWARENVAIETCPTSYVTAQSVAWIEEFLVWRKLGQKVTDNLGAREVEAFVILQEELLAEVSNGK